MHARRIALLVLALALSGCLRNAFNRCTEDPPHPECSILDSGTRADAPAADAPAADASAADAGVPVDAGLAIDAPVPTDAGESRDAPEPDAASDAP